MNTKIFKQFLRSNVASGKHYFLKSEAMSSIALASIQFNVISSRLSKEKLIRHLSHGFFVIISDASSHFGYPNIAQFLDKYMEHINTRYYLSLLTGAEFYGLSHQKQQVCCVITEKPTKNIIFDKLTISFYSLAHRFASASYAKRDLNDGSLNIAATEQVCIDLITFYEQCGYWNNVCTIISDLVKECDTVKLALLIQYVKTMELQRLGYIFEFIAESSSFDFVKEYKKEAASNLARVIKLELDKRKVYLAPLTPSEPLNGTHNIKWKLILNDIIEPDL